MFAKNNFPSADYCESEKRTADEQEGFQISPAMRSCWRTPSKHSPTRQESHSWAGKECCSRLSLNCIHSTCWKTYLTNQSDITCFAQAVSKPSAVVGVSGSCSWWIVILILAFGSEFGVAGEKLKPAAGQRIGHSRETPPSLPSSPDPLTFPP